MARRTFLVSLMIALSGLVGAQTTGGKPANADIKDEILKVERERDQAMVKGDIATLDRIFADDYFWVSVDGTIHVKAERFADLRSGVVKYESFEQDNYRVQAYPDTVVLTGRAFSPVQYHGRVNSNPRQFTNVYIKENGIWRLAVHQSTPIVEQASTSSPSSPAATGPAPSGDESTGKEKGSNRSQGNVVMPGEGTVKSGAYAEIEKEILRIEDEKDRAMLNHDMDVLDRIYGDELTFVNAAGQVLTKAQRMDEMRSGKVKYTSSLQKSNYHLHVYGNTVIFAAREDSAVEYHGKVISSPRQFVTVYVRLDGQWKYVAHQATPIAEHYFDSLPLQPGAKQ